MIVRLFGYPAGKLLFDDIGKEAEKSVFPLLPG